jgi:hypothetical protein
MRVVGRCGAARCRSRAATSALARTRGCAQKNGRRRIVFGLRMAPEALGLKSEENRLTAARRARGQRNQDDLAVLDAVARPNTVYVLDDFVCSRCFAPLVVTHRQKRYPWLRTVGLGLTMLVGIVGQIAGQVACLRVALTVLAPAHEYTADHGRPCPPRFS